MSHVLPAGVLWALLVMATPALAAEPLPGSDVESLLRLTARHNPEHAAMLHEANAASERVLPAGALMNPRFKLELDDITKFGSQAPAVLPSDAGSTRYTVTQDLPWPGKRDLRRDIATEDYQAARGRFNLALWDTKARVKTLYAQRYFAQANQRLVSQNLEQMLQLEKVLQVRYAGGLSPQQDITRVHVEHTAMRTELVALALEMRQTQARLNLLLDRLADAPLAAPEKLRPLPEPAKLNYIELAERVRHTNLQLLMETSRVKAAAKGSDLSGKNWYPDFTVGINAMQRQGAVNEWGLMLELNLPLQTDVLRAQEREAQAMLEAAKSRQEAVLNQSLADLSENLAALEAARQTEHLMTYSLLPQTDLTWRSAQVAYENGKADFATLLDALRQIRQAQLAQLKARVEAQTRLAEIERLLGEDL